MISKKMKDNGKSRMDRAAEPDNDGKVGVEHKACKHRRREAHDGVTMDWCYAIGWEKVGDMPCEYCVDWSKGEYY